MILNETYDFIKKNYAERIEQLTIDEVRFGVLLTAVRLSDGSHGAASTMPDIQHHCLRKIAILAILHPMLWVTGLRPVRNGEKSGPLTP